MIQKRKKLFLDLDRTLVQTDILNSRIHAAIAQQHPPITAVQLHDEAPTYFVRPDATNLSAYYYPLFRHLEQGHGILPRDVRRIVGSRLLSTELIYDDVLPLLAGLQARPDIEKYILTFGDPLSQELKHNLCPTLGSIAMTCMKTPDKDAYIRTHTTEDDYVMLIDDKIVRNLPPWCIGVLIDRTAEEQVTYDSHGYTINSLEVVPELLDRVFSDNDTTVVA